MKLTFNNLILQNVNIDNVWGKFCDSILRVVDNIYCVRHPDFENAVVYHGHLYSLEGKLGSNMSYIDCKAKQSDSVDLCITDFFT